MLSDIDYLKESGYERFNVMHRSLLYTTFGSGKKVEISISVLVKLLAEYLAISLKESALKDIEFLKFV